MSEPTHTQIEQVLAACREKSSSIAESLNQCFGADWKLSVGTDAPVPYEADAHAAELQGPGLVVSLSAGNSTMLCLIPAGLPLPDWYLAPDEDQKSRLEAMAMEWSVNCLPSDAPAELFATHVSDNLWSTTLNCRPANG